METADPYLSIRLYFGGTQVNSLFQIFLCHRNKQTVQLDDSESIRMMVDPLNAFTPEQQQKLLRDAITHREKRS